MRSTITLTLAATLALTACPGDPTDSTDDTDVFDTGDTDTDDPDTEPPTVTITDDASGVADGDVTFTFTFSEDVGDSFEASDVSVTGGTAGAFSADGTTATLVVSPPADSSGTLELEVAAGSFEDLAGNANEDAVTATQDYDTTVPVDETVLIDFEGDEAAESFGGVVGSVVEDPTDSSNMVGELLKTDSAELWAGATLYYCPSFGITELPFAEGRTTITARVWSPDAGIPIRMKVERSIDTTKSVETEAVTTVAGDWETLSFDFANEAEGTAAINLTYTYDKLSVFPNYGTTGGDAGEKTYYIDDIVFADHVFTNECPETSTGDNLLANPGLEEWPSEGLATGWLVFPGDRSNYTKFSTGDTMFNTEDTFTAYEGTSAIKLYGIYDGVETETPVYQEFSTTAGTTYTMSAWTYMHEADAIAAPDTYLSLQLKFFNDDYSAFDFVESDTIITSTSATNSWEQLTVTGTVPEGFTKVQAAIEFWHCVGGTGDCYTGGGVYVDDVQLSEVE